MTAVLFDLDGVFYKGDKAIAGAPEVTVWFKEQQILHLFLTNTTSQPRTALVRKLDRLGIEVDPSKILTPPVAAVHWLKAHVSGRIALFVPEGTKREFLGLPLLDENSESGASAVVVGDLGEAWNFATLNRAFRLLVAEPRPYLLALGMTRYWQAPDGLRLDTAPFVVALEHASGVKALVLGKPAAAFFQSALDLVGDTAANTVMVGDDIQVDIEGAQSLGMRGILVRTGKFRPTDLEREVKPAAVLDSIASLPAWWKANIGV
jgi:phospholysine phosphohistidine inorganic pyrophosphate phosphatase